jgi:copper(I)-binding protein
VIAESRTRRRRADRPDRDRPARARRFSRAGALAVAAALALAGCAAGQIAQTADQHPTVGGARGNVGNLALRNITVAAAPNGSWPSGSKVPVDLSIVNNGPSDDQLVSVSTSAATTVMVFADSDAYFTYLSAAGASPAPSASTPATATSSATATASASTTSVNPPDASVSPSGSQSTVAASAASSTSAGTSGATRGAVILANTAIRFNNAGGPVVLLDGLTKALRGGETVDITFTFAKAGAVTVAVPLAQTAGQASDAPVLPVMAS